MRILSRNNRIAQSKLTRPRIHSEGNINSSVSSLSSSERANYYYHDCCGNGSVIRRSLFQPSMGGYCRPPPNNTNCTGIIPKYYRHAGCFQFDHHRCVVVPVASCQSLLQSRSLSTSTGNTEGTWNNPLLTDDGRSSVSDRKGSSKKLEIQQQLQLQLQLECEKKKKKDEDDDLEELLTAASLRAREISALVVTSNNNRRRRRLLQLEKKDDEVAVAVEAAVASNERENAMEAADALLSVTSHIHFQEALQQQQQQHCDSVVGLHSAFISVVSWLCSILQSYPPPTSPQQQRFQNNHHSTNILTASLSSTKKQKHHSHPDVLLAKILEVVSRSTDLQLPLHLPLYRTIATLVAHYNTTPDTALLILDLSTQARLSSDSSIRLTSDFFSEALQILAKSHKPRVMITIIEGMYNLHQIEHIDHSTAFQLLTTITQNLDDFRNQIIMQKQNNNNNSLLLEENYQMDEADIMQLTLMLQKPISEQLQERKNDVENFMKTLGITEQDIYDDITTTQHSLNHLQNQNKDNATLEENDDENQMIDQSSSLAAVEWNTISLDEKLALIAKGEATDQLIKEVKEEASKLIHLMKKDDHVVDDDFVSSQTTTTTTTTTTAEPMDLEDDTDSITTIQAKVHVDPTTGTIENIELGVVGPDVPASSLQSYHPNNKKMTQQRAKYTERMHQTMAKEMIYVRSSQAWDLPDLNQQLEKWNNDNDILLTREYEEALIADFMFHEDVPYTTENILGYSHWDNLDFGDEDYDDDDDDDDDDFHNF